MAHREHDDGITVAETFNRRETIADYLDELGRPPAGQVLMIHVADVLPSWFDDWVAVLEQHGRLQGGVRRTAVDGGVRLTANGSWPSSVGSAWVLLSSSTVAAEPAQLAAPAGGAS